MELFFNNIQVQVMKKYQNWLDYQQYNSHLQNLIQIKKRKEMNFRCQTSYPKHSSHHGFLVYDSQNSSYKIKQSKSLCKSYFIRKQNVEYIKRIRNAPAVISKEKLQNDYRKNHWLAKKKSKKINFCELKRQKNMHNFFKINEEKYRKGVHKFSLTFTFISLPKVPLSDFGSYWVQIVTNQEKSSSKHFTSEDIVNKKIQVFLRLKPRNSFLKLRMHYSRGLEYVSGGDYTFSLPGQGTEKKYMLRSMKENKKKLQFLLNFSQLKNNFNDSIFQ